MNGDAQRERERGLMKLTIALERLGKCERREDEAEQKKEKRREAEVTEDRRREGRRHRCPQFTC